MEVLQLWDSWRGRTGGALNPAAEAVSLVWKNAESAGRLPTEREMADAAELANGRQWRIDEHPERRLRLTDSPLKLNSFTKSYIIEKAAAAALRTPGVTAAVVNIGGDLVVRGAASDSVIVTDPRSDEENGEPVAVLNIQDRAVATSGNYRRGFAIERTALFAYRRSAHRAHRRGDSRRNGGGAPGCRCRRSGHGILRAHARAKQQTGGFGARRRVHANRAKWRSLLQRRLEQAAGATHRR